MQDVKRIELNVYPEMNKENVLAEKNTKKGGKETQNRARMTTRYKQQEHLTYLGTHPK